MARQDVTDEVLYLRSAGLDLGKRFLLACVRVPNPRRQGTWSLETERFGTTPAQVRRLKARMLVPVLRLRITLGYAATAGP